MSRKTVVVLAAVVLVAGLAGGVYLRLQGMDDAEDPTAEDKVREEVRAQAEASPFAGDVAVPVEGTAVRRDTFVLWVGAEGKARAPRSAQLRAEVEGPVVEVGARESDFVEAGDVVARLDTAPYALDLRSAEAEHERARAEFRSLLLGEEELGLSEEALEERRRMARVRSGLAQAEVELSRARYELDKTRIRAPFAGRVANLTVVEGTRLSPGDSVARILDLSRVDVAVNVLQTRVSHLEAGRSATVRFTALPDERFEGRVTTINPLVDAEGETVRVTVRLRDPEDRVLPGMHATVQLVGRQYPDRVFVPRDAIVERDRRPVVFVFEPDEPGAGTGRAQWRYVTPALENDRFVEIVPGDATEMVEPGELVLVDGHATLAHDARVRLEGGVRCADGRHR